MANGYLHRINHVRVVMGNIRCCQRLKWSLDSFVSSISHKRSHVKTHSCIYLFYDILPRYCPCNT